jgi:hypothetical protein
VSELVDFLMARIDEDEAIARGATPGRWEWFDDDLKAIEPYPWSVPRVVMDDDAMSKKDRYGTRKRSQVADFNRAFMAHWDPQRALSECGARRALVQQTAGWIAGSPSEGGAIVADRVLRTLAWTYSDHPDYQEAWSA